MSLAKLFFSNIKDKLYFMNRKRTDFSPLVSRTPIKSLVGITYEAYVNHKSGNNLLSLISTSTSISENSKELNYRIQFLFDTKTNLESSKKEIEETFELCFKVIQEDNGYDIDSDIEIYITPLISLVGEAHFSSDENERIITKLEENMRDKIDRIIKQEINFPVIIENIVLWYKAHYEYLKYLSVGFKFYELSYLKQIHRNRVIDFESLKSSSPIYFIHFVNVFKTAFASISINYRLKYREYYLNMALQQIIVAKNAGYFSSFGLMLEDYYKEKLVNKKFLNILYKYLTGYGEKPWRLFSLFMCVNFLFALIFCSMPCDFASPAGVPSLHELCWLERFATFVTFNNTTMLTIGYGDIYPAKIGAKALVMALQIIGFAISSSAIALFLRKMLRF
ncbi:potassium channel family protein [Hymenobacter baengnokdamensis]|uniref:potassium channel family protein n=1 Tax=Hymenobacter baengnokdamensis TaxID=2615203 RepID=UPI00124522DB|nr:potassium channel family protein [Hymenobacter baengnokdamensis]